MRRKIFIIILGFLLILGVTTFYFSSLRTPNMIYGVTYSWEFANWLGFDYQKVFRTILDEWHFRYIRVPVQWETVEPEPGKFDFSRIDWLMAEAAKRKAKVILAVGQKTPRWPECHNPRWALTLSETDYALALNKYIAKTVGRYAEHPALEIWQVENEPFLPFGRCPKFTRQMLKNELELTKSLDPAHPTLVSDSGELSTWIRTSRVADLFGTTMYRVVWNKYLGYWNYDWLPPFHYRLKMWLNGSSVRRGYIMELQAEPWLKGNNFDKAPLAEHYETMNIERMKKNLDYAERVGMPRAYLWGAEWWYWLKQKGQMDIPNFIKELQKD